MYEKRKIALNFVVENVNYFRYMRERAPHKHVYFQISESYIFFFLCVLLIFMDYNIQCTTKSVINQGNQSWTINKKTKKSNNNNYIKAAT